MKYDETQTVGNGKYKGASLSSLTRRGRRLDGVEIKKSGRPPASSQIETGTTSLNESQDSDATDKKESDKPRPRAHLVD